MISVWISAARAIGMVAMGASLGSWLSSESNPSNESTGLKGWWNGSPWVVKVVVGLGLVASAIGIYNWAKYGNWKGKGGKYA